jgi:hypothetical protein
MKRIKSFKLFEDSITIEHIVQECYDILKDLDLDINIEMSKYGKETIFISISHKCDQLFSLKDSISSFDQLISYLESKGFMYVNDECSYEGTNTRFGCPACGCDEDELNDEDENITKCTLCGHEDITGAFLISSWSISSWELPDLEKIFGLELTFRKK